MVLPERQATICLPRAAQTMRARPMPSTGYRQFASQAVEKSATSLVSSACEPKPVSTARETLQCYRHVRTDACRKPAGTLLTNRRRAKSIAVERDDGRAAFNGQGPLLNHSSTSRDYEALCRGWNGPDRTCSGRGWFFCSPNTWPMSALCHKRSHALQQNDYSLMASNSSTVIKLARCK